jgi:hypothetical protein
MVTDEQIEKIGSSVWDAAQKLGMQIAELSVCGFPDASSSDLVDED